MRTLLGATCPVLFLALFTLGVPPAGLACPFCSMQGQTLTKEVNQASFVIFGTLSNPRLNADGVEGTTDFAIEDVVKGHPFLKDKKQITLPRYVPETKVKFLIFCDFYKERVDPYRGLPVKDKDIVTYLKGAASLDEKDVPARLQFFFPYLDHAEVEINTDAYKEFANADGKDVMKMVEKGNRDKLRSKLVQWLKDKDTPSYRYGLYGYLLGLCGNEADVEPLLELLNDPQRGLVSGVDGVLAGFIMLKPREGSHYLTNILKDSKADFTRRYAGLRTLRFFWENKSEQVSQKQILADMQYLLDQADIADLAVEDLRRWQQWDQADRILALADRESHNVPIIHRAILRYALSCNNPKAAAYVAEQRRKDPDRVKDVEELLRLDQPIKAAGAGS